MNRQDAFPDTISEKILTKAEKAAASFKAFISSFNSMFSLEGGTGPTKKNATDRMASHQRLKRKKTARRAAELLVMQESHKASMKPGQHYKRFVEQGRKRFQHNVPLAD